MANSQSDSSAPSPESLMFATCNLFQLSERVCCGLQRVQDAREALLQHLAAEKKQAQERGEKLSRKVAALNALKRDLQVNV